MTSEEIKVKEALEVLGYKEIREVTKKEIYYSFIGLEKIYNPQTCTNSEYINGDAYKRLQEAYEYLSNDICKTNELIRNILDPNHKEFVYSINYEKSNEVKPEIIDDYKPNKKENINNNINNAQAVVLRDKPSIINLMLSFLVPFYGFLYYFLVKKMTTKAAKWYLVAALIGVIVNILILYI
ncbi:MAG: hypothetical protein ACI35S_06470 [Anaeroplasma sp.]